MSGADNRQVLSVVAELRRRVLAVVATERRALARHYSAQEAAKGGEPTHAVLE